MLVEDPDAITTPGNEFWGNGRFQFMVDIKCRAILGNLDDLGLDRNSDNKFSEMETKMVIIYHNNGDYSCQHPPSNSFVDLCIDATYRPLTRRVKGVLHYHDFEYKVRCL